MEYSRNRSIFIVYVIFVVKGRSNIYNKGIIVCIICLKLQWYDGLIDYSNINGMIEYKYNMFIMLKYTVSVLIYNVIS